MSNLVHIKTPLIHTSGGNRYQLDLETTADQVKTGDGLDVQTHLNILERAVASNSTVRFAETIGERDALTGLVPGDICIVFDASGDETVNSGSARYCCLPDFTWKKLSEDESMDIVCDWEHVQNRPQSSVSELDLAVARSHRHENGVTLALLGADSAGNLLFNGSRVSDGKVWVAAVEDLADIPANLADGGLVVLHANAQ